MPDTLIRRIGEGLEGRNPLRPDHELNRVETTSGAKGLAPSSWSRRGWVSIDPLIAMLARDQPRPL